MCQRKQSLSVLLLLVFVSHYSFSDTTSTAVSLPQPPLSVALELLTECQSELKNCATLLDRWTVQSMTLRQQVEELRIESQRLNMEIQNARTLNVQALNRSNELTNSIEELTRYVQTLQIQRTILIISTGVVTAGLLTSLIYLAVTK